ncbi:hypothetical protein IAT38_003240 [Cryptococcus sp. DSM 104549]
MATPAVTADISEKPSETSLKPVTDVSPATSATPKLEDGAKEGALDPATAPGVIPDTPDAELYDHPLAQLSPLRKGVLLFIFALADFLDVCNVSGVAIAVAQISLDIDLETSQAVWIITSYSICFSAFLLFAGRLSDLFPAHLVFELGYMGMGILSLATSFATNNKYGFLVLRGLTGITGAMTLPSAYHLTVHMYPDPKEQGAKLAFMGLAGALGNVLGLVLAGLCMQASYHWFFRLVAITAITFTLVALVLLPRSMPPTYDHARDKLPRWRLMDVPGVFIMAGSLICFILSLTQGPIDGWGSASFMAPFVLCWPLAIGFFVWETKIPTRTAILPGSVWKITNAVIMSVAMLIPMGFWATSQLLYANYWQFAYGWKPLHVAAAMLPQGVMAVVVGGAVQYVPAIINKPHWSIGIGAILIIVAEILQIKSNGGGSDLNYWKYVFPAFIIGSTGGMGITFAASINLVQYCPPEMAGVAGAWINVLFQVGGAIALAVQAGMESVSFTSGVVPSWMDAGARSYYFIIGWTAALAAGYVVFYKQPKEIAVEHEEARKRIAEKVGGLGV